MFVKLFKTQSLLILTFVIAGMTHFYPLRAEAHDLEIGKYKSSVLFPCTPERKKQLLAKTELGDIYLTTLQCIKGDSSYLLGITEYTAEIMSALSTEEILDSTLDDSRSKNYIKIKSSKRKIFKNLPAIQSQILDSRKPETETDSLSVIADRYLFVVTVTAQPSPVKEKIAADFLNSFQIYNLKKQ